MSDLASLTDYDPIVDQPIVADPARRIPVYKDDDDTWGNLGLAGVENKSIAIKDLVNKAISTFEGVKLGAKTISNFDQKLTEDVKSVFDPENYKFKDEKPSKTSVAINNVLNKLFRDDDQRYQLWPEKIVRSALTAIPDAYSGKLQTVEDMIPRALDMASFAGTGGLGGVTDATLGATPFLRPALKYKDKLYKGKEGQQHMDVIPEHLYSEFQDMAMKGEDISHYNFGFHNDKGQFLSREKALEYGINTGLIDPQAGKFGALTSTLMADSSKPGMAIEAMGKANPFFSAVEHNVNTIPQAKMNGEAWLGTLSNKPGVKPEELDWTGLKGFLEENKGKIVTKEQIQSHLEQNKVELKETNKGAKSWASLTKEQKQEHANVFSDINGKKVSLNNLELKDWYENNNINVTKYHSYQLPGGENYREMLLTTPVKNSPKTQEGLALTKRMNDGEFNSLNDADRKALFAKRDALLREGKAEEGTPYKSSHWDEPNILAHVRMNDRDVGGKKSLHLEEIQSDWHQQGRDKGYSNLKEIETRQNELKKQIDEVVTERAKLVGAKSPEDRAKYQAAHEKEAALIDEYNNLHDKKAYGVPDAPFKKSWHELALKRMIREAAEKGYDRLSWTPGEAQAARYDLSKQVDEVRLVPKNKNTDPAFEYRIDAFKNGERITTKPANTEKEVADIVGKEVAKKLFEENKDGKGSSLKGQQLSIGGEGMKGFYDQIIPKALEKIGKEHGVKVKQGEIEGKTLAKGVDGNTLAEFKTRKQAEKWLADLNEYNIRMSGKVKLEQGKQIPIHYIDIPKSLRDTAMNKGFPLFSSTHMFIPVDHDPFEKKK